MKLFFKVFFASILLTQMSVANTICGYTGGKDVFFETKDATELWVCEFNKELVGDATFFKHLKKKESKALQTYFNLSGILSNNNEVFMPNPSAVYCVQKGGTFFVASQKYDNEGAQTGFCQFEDQSLIGSWTLFKGCKHSKEFCDFLKEAPQKFPF